jgi:hypothetical protein
MDKHSGLALTALLSCVRQHMPMDMSMNLSPLAGKIRMRSLVSFLQARGLPSCIHVACCGCIHIYGPLGKSSQAMQY